MPTKYPYKDTYDPAPWEQLAADYRAGFDIKQRMVEMLVNARTRPGFLAKRLNLVGIPAPNGDPWTYYEVQEVIWKEKWSQILKGERAGPRGWLGTCTHTKHGWTVC
jgi:hypothetical protein